MNAATKSQPTPSWPSSFLCRAVTRCQRLPCLALPPRLLLTFSLSSKESTLLSLSLFLLFFFPHPAPNSGRLSLKIFCWSSRDGVVSSAAFQLISSLPFNREQRGANRRRGGREGGGGSSIGEIGFFSFFFLFLRGKPGLLKDSASRIGGVNAGLMGNF